ncbi:hypothetical protein [Streptomyces sp. NPDC006285]|uniref:hypothetical protein n=1 Tax=Streptomyces sp. NPDC006285 TaxID=3364742 RepID=UPI0036A7A2A9
MEAAEPAPAGPPVTPAGTPGGGSDEAPDGRPDPLAGFVPDPAARAELARRMSELAGLLDEAGDVLGEILENVQRGRDSAERSRGANRSST